MGHDRWATAFLTRCRNGAFWHWGRGHLFAAMSGSSRGFPAPCVVSSPSDPDRAHPLRRRLRRRHRRALGHLPTWAPAGFALRSGGPGAKASRCTIKVQLTQPSDFVWLHGKDLKVAKVTVTDTAGKKRMTEVRRDAEQKAWPAIELGAKAGRRDHPGVRIHRAAQQAAPGPLQGRRCRVSPMR